MNVLEIVNICYDKYVPVIVTTSLSPEILDKETNITRRSALGRLKERCYCLTLANVQRKKKQAKKRNDRYCKLLGIANGNARSHNRQEACNGKHPVNTGSGNDSSGVPTMASLYEDMVLAGGTESEE